MILTCFEESIKRLKTTELIMNDEKSKNKEAQTNYFGIGGARELSPHILNKNKIPVLTSSTSVHCPLKGINEESKKRINEIKETFWSWLNAQTNIFKEVISMQNQEEVQKTKEYSAKPME